MKPKIIKENANFNSIFLNYIMVKFVHMYITEMYNIFIKNLNNRENEDEVQWFYQFSGKQLQQ